MEERLRVADRRDKRDAVACLQPERARRNIDLLLAALDRADKNLGLYEVRQLHERLARENGVLRDLHLQKLHMAVCKRICFDGRRNAQCPGNLSRAQ